MSSRVRHPAKSFLLFAALCGLAYAGWMNRDYFKGSPADHGVKTDQRDQVREGILRRFGDKEAFLGIRGNLNWRPNEQRYRLDIEIAIGHESEARTLCRQIAMYIREETELVATVTAFDSSGRELGRHVL